MGFGQINGKCVTERGELEWQKANVSTDDVWLLCMSVVFFLPKWFPYGHIQFVIHAAGALQNMNPETFPDN